MREDKDPKCPACGKSCFVAVESGEMACSDPACENAHGMPVRVVLDDISYARFEKEMKNPSPPTAALVDLFRNR